jgi:GT2 family glycosyltransferase
MLIRRDVLDAIGLLDEDYFFTFEDLDFCLRAERAGYATWIEPAASAYHEGSRSIGAGSTDRLYFATRNHLLMARRLSTSAGVASAARSLSILALNLAHAARFRGGSLAARLGAVVDGARDYWAGRYGARRPRLELRRAALRWRARPSLFFGTIVPIVPRAIRRRESQSLQQASICHLCRDGSEKQRDATNTVTMSSSTRTAGG